MYMTLFQVIAWAIVAHGDQKYGAFAYGYHLAKVTAVANRFGFSDEVILMACWLHDVLEDTQYTKEDMLAAGIDPRAVAIAVLLTDEPGATRKERKLKTYPKIKTDRMAIAVKLFDRIGNVEECVETNNSSQLEKYKSEHPEFEHQLRDRTDAELEPLWLHLEQLFNKQ